jgi:hypothetical protein
MRQALALFVVSVAAWGQAKVNGRVLSQAEIDALLMLAPPEVRRLAAANPEELLRYYGVIERLVELAQKEKVTELSPYKEQIVLKQKQAVADTVTGMVFCRASRRQRRGRALLRVPQGRL